MEGGDASLVVSAQLFLARLPFNGDGLVDIVHKVVGGFTNETRGEVKNERDRKQHADAREAILHPIWISANLDLTVISDKAN